MENNVVAGSSTNSAQVELLDEEIGSEVVADYYQPPIAGTCFKLIELLETLYILGMDSLNKWELVINGIKTNDNVTENPYLLQISFILQELCKCFSHHIYSNTTDLNQERIIISIDEAKSFNEILSILNPLLKKKSFKDKVFSSDIVQCFLRLVKTILFGDKKRKLQCKKNNFKKCKRVKKSCDVSSNSSSSSSTDTDLSGQEEDEFAKLFQKSEKRQPIIISQQFQYQTSDCRKKITTPGEQGTHLIKIEITDTKDLKKCKGEKFFWTKVSRKGYFLLNLISNDRDGEILNSLNNILSLICERILQIKNVKKESFVVERKPNEK